MKINFRKITAIGASLLMAGMTAGIAAAANFPAPFVQNSVADVAIVYGTGAGVSSLDLVQAGQIQTKLGESMPSSGGSTASGGDSILLERATDKLHLGDSAGSVFVTSITADNLPTLLADGTYTDHSNSEYDFTQKITLGNNLNLTFFSDSDYKDSAPSIGVKIPSGAHVLNYTLDFATNPAFNASTMEYTTLKMMNKDYYVLDVKGVGDGSGGNSTTLLDSANSAIVTEGTTATIGGKTVSIEYIGASEVKLSVNGEVTNSLAEGGTYKLTDGSYVGVKDIMFVSKDTGVSKAEIVIGSGKLKITDGSEVQMNDVTVSGLYGYLQQDSSYKLDKIVLQWKTDDKGFVTKDSSLEMPGFKAVKFSFGDFVIPKEELTTVKNDGNSVIQLTTTITGGEVTIPLLEANSTGQFELIGKSSTERLVTSTDSNLFFNETAGDQFIVTSWNSTTEAESYYLKLKLSKDSNQAPQLTVTDKVTGTERTLTNGSTMNIGSFTLYAENITYSGDKKWANLSYVPAATGDSSFKRLYTKDGLKIYLPYVVNDTCTAEGAVCSLNSSGTGFGHYSNITWIDTNAGHGGYSFYLYFTEEDKDSGLAKGNKFNITLAESGTSDKVHVSAIGVNTGGDSGSEIGDTNNYKNYVKSALATQTMYYTGGDQDYVEITYHGDQAYGKLYLTAPETVVSGNSTLGNVLVKDTEVSSVSTKNLVVVGGSCINSAAANILGSAYCGPGFTTNTKVGAGQFLIKSVASPYSSTKVALLVAGYEAADTTNAATYLRTQTVDTTVGKTYIGTSSTSATLQVA